MPAHDLPGQIGLRAGVGDPSRVLVRHAGAMLRCRLLPGRATQVPPCALGLASMHPGPARTIGVNPLWGGGGGAAAPLDSACLPAYLSSC